MSPSSWRSFESKIRIMENQFGNDYLSTAIKRMKYYKDLGDKTFEQLVTEDFHYSPDRESNSIAVIIQHLYGNMKSRWTNFLTEDGEKTWRERDAEFEIHPYSRQEILDLWEQGWSCFLDSLSALRPEDLGKTVYIRQEPLTVVDAVNRQLAHYPYHVGQIVFLGRMIRKDQWKSLSIARGQSQQYNQSEGVKDPARNYR